MIIVIIDQKHVCYTYSPVTAVYSADFIFFLPHQDIPPCGRNISWVDISLLVNQL